MIIFLFVGTSALFADGSSAAMWFAGTIVEAWVNKDALTRQDITEKTDMILNHPVEMMNIAVRNFHQFLWVGILEDTKRSLDLLEFQLGVKIKSDTAHKNGNKHTDATDVEKLVIATANPMDMALYEYISKIQYARMRMYEDSVKNNVPVVICDENEIDTFSYPFYFNGTQIW
jgi:hypothetical protein